MNHAAVIHAFFDEYCVARPDPASPAAPGVQTLPHTGGTCSDRIIETMTPAYPVAMLVALCTRELQRHLPGDEEATIGTQMHCWRCAPCLAGSRIRMTGWVERLGERDVTFHVTAQDEQEQIYEGHVQFAIVRRVEMARLMSRKRDAIARREMLSAA